MTMGRVGAMPAQSQPQSYAQVQAQYHQMVAEVGGPHPAELAVSGVVPSHGALRQILRVGEMCTLIHFHFRGREVALLHVASHLAAVCLQGYRGGAGVRLTVGGTGTPVAAAPPPAAGRGAPAQSLPGALAARSRGACGQCGACCSIHDCRRSALWAA